MRVSLQRCALLIYAAVSVNGGRTVRGPNGDDSSRYRSLKKGEGDEDQSDDYYYESEEKKSKGSADHAAVPIAPVIRPSAESDSVAPGKVTTATPSNLAARSVKRTNSNKKEKKAKKEKNDSSSSDDTKRTSKGNRETFGRGESTHDEGGKGTGGKSKKGKGGSKNGMGICTHAVADEILAAVPEVITRNPDSCCGDDGPIAVYVTHGQRSDHTFSGFELFWDEIYQEIERASLTNDVCFVMTGVDDSMLAAASNQTLDAVLTQANTLVSELDQVAAMMVTDPTVSVELITEIRRISDNTLLPSIGIFNAGYNNVVIESILSGQDRLPYVGYLNDSDYGKEAGKISLNLLNGVEAKPLCLNSRFGVLDFVGERCAAYYNEVSTELIEPEFGVACSPNTTSADIVQLLNQNGNNDVDTTINAVWASLECCEAAAEAVASVRSGTGRNIVIGCQDGNALNHHIDFITQQPIALQAYSASSWVNFPVIQGKLGKDTRGGQYFPSLQSLSNTAIFNTVIL